MLSLIKDVFAARQFIPHGHCYLWQPKLVGLHILSDSIIGVAYYSIPIALIYFVRKRQDIPFNWMFFLFSAFIFACGTTHFMAIWTLWHPVYWLSGLLKAITALVSLYTALAIVPLIPKALGIPSPAQLENINQELKHQIIERQQAEIALKTVNDELEKRVNNRTLELARTNQKLQKEIQQRLQIEAALQQKNELLQTIFDNVPVMIGLFDSNGYFKWANREFETILGWRVEDIQGPDLLPKLYPDPEYLQYVIDFIGAAERRWEEFQTRTRDGRVIDTTWANVYLRDGSIVGIGQDISNYKLAQKKLAMSESQYRLLFERNPNPMWIVDPENLAFVAVNQAAIAHYGYSQSEFLSMTLVDIRPPEDVPKFRELAEQYRLSDPDFIYQGESRHCKWDGSIIDVEITSCRIIWEGKLADFVMVKDITKRKQAEDKLQTYAAELEELYNNAPCGYHSVDKDGKFIRINDTELKMLGYQREEVLGKMKITDFLTRESLISFQENFSSFQKRGWVRDLEFQMIRQDGTILPVSLSGAAVQDAAGNFLFSRSVILDISAREAALRDRQIAEQALWETQQQLQAILDNSPAIIYLIDSQNRIILVSRSYAKFLSTNVENLIGKSLYEVWPSEIADTFVANNQRVLQENQAIEVEETCSNVEGVHTFITIKFPIHNANGIPYAVCGISTDITERQQAQQKILEQAALIDVSTDAIFVRDLENHILFWSRGAESLYGWTADESLGKVTHEIFKKESLSQLEAGLKATIEHGSWQGELEQITKTGREIIVASRWTLVQDLFGQPQSILVVNTDITEKKQLEQKFYRAQRLESVGTLASGIAHDLNNVFSPIMMIAQLLPLRCKNVDAQTQQMFQTLEFSSQRGSDLVKQILTFARGTEGKRILLQPGHLLKELVKVIKQTFPKSIAIVTNIPTNTLWMVKANPTQLEQVFMNLAVNARDAMANGGKLSISVENRIIDETYAQMRPEAHVGDYVVISISDTGTGIPPELLERIFDPFFTTKEVGKGTGLGLSTVLGIVQNHDGFVEVSTQVGKGTEFQVFLPRGEGNTTETIKKTELLKGNGELILVVDDETAVQKTIRTTLENCNFKILAANDGIEAIALYIKYQSEISAVLLDMLMPNMDGLIAIRTLQTLNPNVKVIATSGLAANETKAMAAGAQKFLSKPYTATNLLNTLSEIIL